MFKEVLKRKLVIPQIHRNTGDGKALTRQLDLTLIKSGWKLSADAIEFLSGTHPVHLKSVCDDILSVLAEVKGNHVKHNVYFKRFPLGVPDTLEFWVTEILRLFFTGKTKYGRYQHSYEEMLEFHQEYLQLIKDKYTIIHLGKELLEEVRELYTSLSESKIPLNQEDLNVLMRLTPATFDIPFNAENIKIRENLAVVNSVRLTNDQSIFFNDPTDVLRLSAHLSGGDVTLQKKTKFKSFPRKYRKAIVLELEKVISNAPYKLENVLKYMEEWKRLGERLYPGEYKIPAVNDVFAVARGDLKCQSFAGQVESAYDAGDHKKILSLLKNSPGVLFRNLDRFMTTFKDVNTNLIKVVKEVAPKVSSRVILSVMEHLINRQFVRGKRIFTNKLGKSYVVDENRPTIITHPVGFALKDEMIKRLPDYNNIYCEPEMFNVSVPTSNKTMDDGFNVLPRGSVFDLEGYETLRFFAYWKQKKYRTDYDLSAVGFDKNFNYQGHVSWTRLSSANVVHSGDLTDATHGATEFIDIKLDKVNFEYIIPSLQIFSGENFNEVEESFFGFMNRYEINKGKPFEPAAVRFKSNIKGTGRIYMPFVLYRNVTGWRIKWLNIYLTGNTNFNMVERNVFSTSLQAKTIFERQYITIFDFLEMLEVKGADIRPFFNTDYNYDLYIGMNKPEGLNEDCKVITPANLYELIP